MFDSYIEALRRSFDFEGRMRRADYWSHQVFTGVFCLSAAWMEGKLPTSDQDAGLIFTLCVLAHMPSLLSSTARRVHDVNKTGWIQLFHIVPGGSLYILYLLLQPSDEGANRFGPPTSDDGAEIEKELMAALNRPNEVLLAGIEKLEQLAKLHSEGAVDDEQYARMRGKILEIMNR